MKNWNMMVKCFEGSILRRSLRKLTTRPLLIRSIEFISYTINLIVTRINILGVSSRNAIKLSVRQVHSGNVT